MKTPCKSATYKALKKTNYPIFTEVIENEPATTASLKKETLSFLPRKATEYNIGK